MSKARLLVLLLVACMVLGSFSAALAQDATELTLWVFADRHGLFMQKQAERWNEEHPDRSLDILVERIDYTQMHDNLLASLLGWHGRTGFG